MPVPQTRSGTGVLPLDLPGDAGLADVELLQLEIAAKLGRSQLLAHQLALDGLDEQRVTESLSQTFWLMTPMLAA